MRAGRILATLSLLGLAAGAPAGAQVAPPGPPPGGSVTASGSSDLTPPRVSYLNGEVSYWRPGAEDWSPAQLNTPLAPGDVLYAGPSANVEIQIGPGAFARAAEGTQIGLDNQDSDLVQLRVTSGHVSLDLRQLPEGSAVELDTPNATFSIERAGYYRVDVDQSSTAFAPYRGGDATMTTVGGGVTLVSANQRVVVTGTDSPRLTLDAAPALTAWDQWNQTRTDQLLHASSARYVPPTVYGAEALDAYGSWRSVATYGQVWVPTSVPVGWVPYSTGRWIWDPRYGWTWLDDAPWGWAPYHHGRWVFIDDYWAWAPGPIVVRPVYAPALVVFVGGPIGVHQPVCWAPLGWGEPLIPWWGRPGFRGVPHWAGWGGPRVVNNVIIDRSTTVNVTNITVYKHVTVTPAVIGVPADNFGRGHLKAVRIAPQEVHQLRPMRGAPEVRPVAASLVPGTGATVKPSPALQARPVVATRAPKDLEPALRAEGLDAKRASMHVVAVPRLVPSPRPLRGPVHEPGHDSTAPAGTSMPPVPKPGGRGRDATGVSPEAQKTPNAPPHREAVIPEPQSRGGRQGQDTTPVLTPATPGGARIAGPPPPPKGTPPPGRQRDTTPGKEAPSVLPPGPPGIAKAPGPPPQPQVVVPERRPHGAPGKDAAPVLTPATPGGARAAGPPPPPKGTPPGRQRDSAPGNEASPVAPPGPPGIAKTPGPPPRPQAAAPERRPPGPPGTAKAPGPPARPEAARPDGRLHGAPGQDSRAVVRSAPPAPRNTGAVTPVDQGEPIGPKGKGRAKEENQAERPVPRGGGAS
jgi:hypothetical protein